MELKRHHPLVILFELITVLKDNIILILILFVLNYNTENLIIKVGQYGIIFYFIYKFIHTILKWFTNKYRVTETSFYLYEGIFVKKERTIPFDKIQNIKIQTTALHRLFGLTSLQLETSITGGDVSVKFQGLSFAEAEGIEATVKGARDEKQVDEEVVETFAEAEENEMSVHFRPTKKDTFKASFTSLSFLVLFPVIASIYSQIENFVDLESQTKGIMTRILGSPLLVTLIIVVITLVAIAVGIVWTYLKYGKYEIRSDQERIYITQGVISETSFSIIKDKVQAVEINQSLMKRILGLAEVRLISIGSDHSRSVEEDSQMSSLYPFLPVKRAYEMIHELLPEYEVMKEMHKLPKVSLYYRLIKPSYVWLIATAWLAYVQPTIFGIDQAWWMASFILLLIIELLRIVDFYNTSYNFKDEFIQVKKGSLYTTLLLSKRSRIIEVETTANLIQQKLQLASFELRTRENPFYLADLQDLPEADAKQFCHWYANRLQEIKYTYEKGTVEE